MLAPIALFVYNRPRHTQLVLENLAKNLLANKSKLVIYADGIKNTSDYQEVERVNKVRKVIREKKWCKEVIFVESDFNQGLQSSIIKGVTEIINNYGKIIVLEDDMLTSKYFLKFMNDALSLYENEHDVACISGYVPPIKTNKLFLIKGAEIWGWGTWKRAWDLFEVDGSKLLNALESQSLTYRFDMNGTFNCTDMLKQQIDGKISSWGIRWYASIFLANKLHLYPFKSLIKNIGRDGSGTNEGIILESESDLYNHPIEVIKINIQESELELNLLVSYFRKINTNKFNFSLRYLNNLFSFKWYTKVIYTLYKRIYAG